MVEVRRLDKCFAYHGVFAGRAKLRRAVTALVPGAAASRATARAPGTSRHDGYEHDTHPPDSSSPRLRQPSRLPWADLLRRVFREDLEVCSRCTGPVRVLAAIADPDVIAAILSHLDLAPPPAARSARAPPDLAPWSEGGDLAPDFDAYDPA